MLLEVIMVLQEVIRYLQALHLLAVDTAVKMLQPVAMVVLVEAVGLMVLVDQETPQALHQVKEIMVVLERLLDNRLEQGVAVVQVLLVLLVALLEMVALVLLTPSQAHR